MEARGKEKWVGWKERRGGKRRGRRERKRREKDRKRERGEEEERVCGQS